MASSGLMESARVFRAASMPEALALVKKELGPEAIILGTRALPAGVKLAVKEHVTAVGRRPDDFYGQIAEFKNVVMLDPFELGLACTKAAAVTVTICDRRSPGEGDRSTQPPRTMRSTSWLAVALPTSSRAARSPIVRPSASAT